MAVTWNTQVATVTWTAVDDPSVTWVVQVDATVTGGGGGGVELGETSTTAYRGDRGKTAYDHSQVTTGNPHGTTASDVGADPAGTAAGLVDDLSGVSDQATARTNLGLGTAATAATGDFAATSHTHTGTQVSVDASGFNGNLTTSDDTVQEVAQKLDDLVIPAAGIPASIIDAKGDLIVGTAADTAGRLPVSATNGAVLVADSAETTGLNWAVDPFVVTCPGATPTLLSGVANWAFAMRAYGSGWISKIALQIGTSAGDICVGHYANTGIAYNATPATRLATSGAVACPASGYREVALTAPTYVRTGDWLAVSFSSSSATSYGVAAPGSSSANNGLSWAGSGRHPLPSSFAATSGDRQFRLWGVA